MTTVLYNYFSQLTTPSIATLLIHIMIVIGLAILSLITNQITKQILLRAIRYITKKTTFTWDDALLSSHAIQRLAHLIPIAIIYIAIPLIYQENTGLIGIVLTLCKVYVVFNGILIADGVITVIETQLSQSYLAEKLSFKTYSQLIKLLLYFLGFILILAILLNKSPLLLLSGLGALTAVLMFVFKDAILGLVAGIQLSANKMVQVGDWIEVPSLGADGDVIEIGLTSVKVQNWDKTISTIPPHYLVSHSFKNWRGMSESGGRRIKRAFNVDLNTIHFASPELIEKCKKLQFLHNYIAQRQIEISKHNKDIDTSHPANGRRLTNVGLFQAYLRNYLKAHPNIHQNMTLLVRQLKPTETGLPIELYVFSNNQNWVNYELIQADIFDHILAILPEFELAIFQQASGNDFKRLN